MIDTVTGRIWVHYGYLQIGQRDRFGQPLGDRSTGDGVIIPGDGYAHVLVGLHTGEIQLTVNVHDSVPPLGLNDANSEIACTQFSHEEIGVETFGHIHDRFFMELFVVPAAYIIRASFPQNSLPTTAATSVFLDLWPNKQLGVRPS
ncbi:hypothetical protein JOF53_008593 [Crossiella equi]|uniref:Uncharacterized protein n=1 Tax=Crossiella equi TaxID=130796 RepID=A0ABS5ATD9_9PSEU|nr:hypothetical protein [Crossiella equi]MBP2479721.1 hypothetical protein [Crossiella equi]